MTGLHNVCLVCLSVRWWKQKFKQVTSCISSQYNIYFDRWPLKERKCNTL